MCDIPTWLSKSLEAWAAVTMAALVMQGAVMVATLIYGVAWIVKQIVLLW